MPLAQGGASLLFTSAEETQRSNGVNLSLSLSLSPIPKMMYNEYSSLSRRKFTTLSPHFLYNALQIWQDDLKACFLHFSSFVLQKHIGLM